VEDGQVTLTNDDVCSRVGVGTVKFKMVDGIVRVLKEVWHVPKLGKNLISLMALDSKDTDIQVEGENWTLWKAHWWFWRVSS
jgi:hypothetical protein